MGSNLEKIYSGIIYVGKKGWYFPSLNQRFFKVNWSFLLFCFLLYCFYIICFYCWDGGIFTSNFSRDHHNASYFTRWYTCMLKSNFTLNENPKSLCSEVPMISFACVLNGYLKEIDAKLNLAAPEKCYSFDILLTF